MKLLAVLLIQAMFSLKIEPVGFKKGEVANTKSLEPIFKFTITEAEPLKLLTLNAVATSEKDKTKKIPLELKGTFDTINNQIANTKLDLVVDADETYKVEAKVTDDESKKSATFKYKFKAVPVIGAEYVSGKFKEKDTDFKYLKLADTHIGKPLTVLHDPLPAGMEMHVEDNHVVVKKKPIGPFPEVKFHVFDPEKPSDRTINYKLLAKPYKQKLSKRAKIILGISGLLVLVMIGVMAYFYFMNQKAKKNTDSNNVRLFSSSEAPVTMTLPVPAVDKNSTIDLRAVHGKPADRI